MSHDTQKYENRRQEGNDVAARGTLIIIIEKIESLLQQCLVHTPGGVLEVRGGAG